MVGTCYRRRYLVLFINDLFTIIMPIPFKKYRTYCKTCQNFTIHSWKSKEDIHCDACDTKDTGYIINEIDPQLIEEQRKRYQRYKLEGLNSIYSKFIKGYGLQGIMELDNIRQDIQECDAGQINIDKQKKALKEAEEMEYQQEVQWFKNNFKLLGRNDKCGCGSGKKYKQCHLLYYRDRGIA
jgi:uncharacterized protein YchJ